ncbi:MAG: adenosylmethionine--8-amino-7-oxononanoate transaminase [Myxococcota bacterium]
MSLVERDLGVLWHPATHFADHERLPPVPIERAQGAFLHTLDGRALIDGISSWWTCLHGHGHPAIVEAITRQAQTLDHVMLAGFTHGPAVELAEALVEVAPGDYGRVFYADCGSAAIEVAMKMSFQWRRQNGQPQRQRFAALRNSYHGETLGALGVSGTDAYRETFAPLLPDVLYLPAPKFADHTPADLGTGRGDDADEADDAIALLRAHADELTALVLEPLVQGAGKMAMTGSGFYARVVREAQALGIHVIADEIAVAFGRTGSLFASTWANVTPDLLCLSKGLSGGVLPLSCVMVARGFDDGFKGGPGRSFLHSHTFTGNPIACAAGAASLKLLREERLPALPDAVAAMERARHAVAAACGDRVRAHRQAGMIVAFDLDPGDRMPADGRLSLALRKAALHAGALLRPLHDTLYWMPPLSLSAAELDTLAGATVHAVEAVLGR